MRDLMRRLLDEGVPTPDQSDEIWERIQARLRTSPGGGKRVAVGGAALALGVAAAALLLRPPALPPAPRPRELNLYVARSDRPPSEALVLTVKESP